MFKPTAGKFSTISPAWSPDGGYVTVACGRLLRTYTMRTSPPKRVATLVGHEKPVTAIVSLSNMRVLSGSEDGTIREWDQLSGHCLRTRDLARPVRGLVALESAALILSDHSLIHYTLLPTQTISGKTPAEIKARRSTFKKPTLLLSAFSDSSKCKNARIASDQTGSLVALSVDKTLYLMATPADDAERRNWKEYPRLRVTFPFDLTAVAVSADGCSVAVADTAGKMYVRLHANTYLNSRADPRCPTFKLSNFSPTVLHWHSSAVSSLAFTSDSAALLSAGNEAVLVSWSLSRHRLGAPSFIPRLRAPIVALSVPPEGSRVALVQTDNVVRVVDTAASEIFASMRGLACEPLQASASQSKSSSIQLSRDNAVAAAGGPHLLVGAGPIVQTFDALSGSHVAELMVVDRNMLYEKDAASDPYAKPGDVHRHEKPGIPHVTSVARSLDGKWIASIDEQTVETKGTSLYGGEPKVVTLRVWRSKQEDHAYQLISVTKNPHGVGTSVSSLVFHPTLPILLSTSKSGEFRLWRTAADRFGNEVFRCELVQDHRGLPCNDGAFSDDGSILGIAFGNVVTLWYLTDLMEQDQTSQEGSSGCSLQVQLIRVLVHPPAEEPFLRIIFVMRKVPMFVAITVGGIYAWNALTQGLWWSTRTGTDGRCLTADERTGRFAVVLPIPLITSNIDVGNSGRSSGATKAMGRRAARTVERKNVASKRTGKAHNNTQRTKRDGLDVRSAEADSNSLVDPMKDCAVAVFDAATPVPLRVLRLTSGVAVSALEFVHAPETVQSLHSDGPTEESGRLVCVDSNGDVSELLMSGESDNTPLETTQGGLLASDEQLKGGLSNLLGANWRDEAAEFEAKAPEQSEVDVTRMPRNLKKAFDEHFDGPVHIQAPVSTKTVAFLEAILEGLDGEAESDNQSEIISPESTRNGEAVDTPDGDVNRTGYGHRNAPEKSEELDEDQILTVCNELWRSLGIETRTNKA